MEREMRIRNYSERTIATYLSLLRRACLYLNLPPGQITTDQFKSYLYYLKETKHCATSTLNQMISAWRILQQDVLGRKWEDINIKRPRKEKKLPLVLSRQEALTLINTPVNLKHRAILTLAYTTGIRRNEILELTPQHIDRQRQVIRIHGKGNKQREVYMPPGLLQLLEKYYRQYRPLHFLFEGQRKGSRYAARTVEVVVKNTALKAGIKKDISPHVLRHSFATHMLEEGVNLKRLQMLMGHSSMQTTSIYLHLVGIGPASLPDLGSVNE